MVRERSVQVIDLSYGEMRVIDPLPEAINAGRTAYTRRRRAPRSPFGDEALRAMFAAQLKRRSGLEVSPDEVLVIGEASSRVLRGLLALIAYRVEPSLVGWKPFWFGYPLTAQLAGIQELLCVDLRPDNGFQPDGAFVSFLDRPIGAVLLNDIQNPLGTLNRPDAVREVAEAVLARPEHTVLVEDQHFMFTRPEAIYQSAPALVPELWSQNRFVGIAATRLAFGVGQYCVTFLWAPKERIRELERSGIFEGYELRSGSDAATRVCLGEPGDRFLEQVAAGVRENLAALERFTEDLPCCRLIAPVEGGTNAFLDISDAIHSVSLHQLMLGLDRVFCSRVMRSCKVALFPGSEFYWNGGQCAVRINLAGATTAEFKEALERLAGMLG